MSDTRYLSIGEFSARARLSIRMLRHYDERGLLTPAEIDAQTGYRRYTADQLDRAALIRRLRDVGFTVSAIAAVLAARGSDAYHQALLLQRETLASDLRVAQGRLTLIDHLIRSQGDIMNDITVSRATVPAMTVVSLRGTVPTYSDEGQLWARMMPEIAAQGITPIGPGGVIEHDGEYRESDVDESIWLPVAPGTTVNAPLSVTDLPERETVVARVVGPYSLITEAHTRIDEFARSEGIEFANANEQSIERDNFNVYLTMPGEVPDDQHVTEVHMVIG
ncbi:MerR family transcriptional regulator [Humibacter soli]